MKTWRIVFVLAVLGCGSRDPFAGSHEPLAAGVEVLTHYDKAYGVPGRDDQNKVEIALSSGQGIVGAGFDFVAVGTKARVVEDAEANGDKPKRPVRVLVLEGQYEGEVCTIARERLRPIAK